jgi:addiction module HigA family antidote
VLKPYLGALRRVGHEAGSLSPWLHPELLKLGLPAVCLETLHVRAVLKAQRNKTDKADALGIVHIMRTEAEIAQPLGISRQHLYDALRERKPVSPAVAVRLGKLFGDGAGVWVRRQAAYDTWHAEREEDVSGIPTLRPRTAWRHRRYRPSLALFAYPRRLCRKKPQNGAP